MLGRNRPRRPWKSRCLPGHPDQDIDIHTGADERQYHGSMGAVIQRPWHEPTLGSEKHAVLDSDQRQSPAHPLNAGRVASGCLDERTEARGLLGYSALQNVPRGLSRRSACSSGGQAAHARPDREIIQPHCPAVPDALSEATSSRLIRYRLTDALIGPGTHVRQELLDSAEDYGRCLRLTGLGHVTDDKDLANPSVVHGVQGFLDVDPPSAPG